MRKHISIMSNFEYQGTIEICIDNVFFIFFVYFMLIISIRISFQAKKNLWYPFWENKGNLGRGLRKYIFHIFWI